MHTSIALSLPLLLIAPLAAQLKPGNYLAGTQGFIDGRAYDGFNSIQALDPYTNKARVLDVHGIPAKEIPGDFILCSRTCFLVGTKVASAPAQGNVYRVEHNGEFWVASKLNATDLAINVGSMVADTDYVYVTGADSFGATSTVAQVKRIRLSDGQVNPHSAFGAAFMAGGALGIPGGMQLLDGKLHIFTFNGGPAVTDSEHWTVTTSTPAVAKQVGADLPPSQRFAGRGFAASDSVYDPRTGTIVVVGRWGEILFRDPETGANLGYERYPGPRSTTTPDFQSEQPRAAALNSDTWAIAFGDHRQHDFGTAGVDERRFNGASTAEPFSVDVVTTRQPKVEGTTLLTTISALAYLPGGGLFHPYGDGCSASDGAAPRSYVSQPPSAGAGNLYLTVDTSAPLAILNIGARIQQDLTALGAPGCVDLVAPGIVVPVPVAGGRASYHLTLPASTPPGTTMFTQWQVTDAGANSLGLAFSEGRKLVVQ